MEFVKFMTIIFAAKFLSLLFTEEEGPFHLAQRLRDAIQGDVADIPEPGEEPASPPSQARLFLQGVFSCYRCFSPYASVIAWLLWIGFRPLAHILGSAGAVIWLVEFNKRND